MMSQRLCIEAASAVKRVQFSPGRATFEVTSGCAAPFAQPAPGATPHTAEGFMTAAIKLGVSVVMLFPIRGFVAFTGALHPARLRAILWFMIGSAPQPRLTMVWFTTAHACWTGVGILLLGLPTLGGAGTLTSDFCSD